MSQEVKRASHLVNKLSACNSGVIVNKRGFDVIILKLLRLFLDHHLNQSEIEMEYSVPRYTMQLVSPQAAQAPAVR